MGTKRPFCSCIGYLAKCQVFFTDEPTTLTKIAGDVFVRPTIEMLNELSSPDFHVPMFPDEVPDVTYSECIVACHNANCFAVTYILETKMCRMAFQPMLLQNDAHLSPEKGVAVNMAMKFGIASSEVMEGTTNSTCVRRVMMQERIVYKDEIQCTHTYQESCSDVYKTVFNTQEVQLSTIQIYLGFFPLILFLL